MSHTSVRAFMGIALALVLGSGAPASASQPNSPQEALLHYRDGNKLLRSEMFERAEREFRTSVRLDPKLELGYYGLGQVYMVTKQYSRAIDAYLACREAYQKNIAEATTSVALNRKALDDRIRTLEDIKNSYETRFDDSTEAQRIQMQINQLRLARDRRADQVLGVPAWISVALGSAYFRSGLFEKAEVEYRAAVAADPKVGESHNNLAVVLMLTGRLQEATQEVSAAERAGFRVNPNFKNELNTLARQQPPTGGRSERPSTSVSSPSIVP